MKDILQSFVITSTVVLMVPRSGTLPMVMVMQPYVPLGGSGLDVEGKIYVFSIYKNIRNICSLAHFQWLL